MRARAARSCTGGPGAAARAGSRGFGWYPGDWVWVSLATLLVAAAGAAAAIVVTTGAREHAGRLHATAHGVPGRRARRAADDADRATVDTSTLPTAPEPGAKPDRRRTAAWPGRANENGWTIVLVSYPKTNGRTTALATATRAAKAGLRQVGIIDSGGFASLQPGYYVVFTGIYGSKADADAASRPPARPGSAAPTRGRSPAEPARCKRAADWVRSFECDQPRLLTENICNSAWQRVESPAGRARHEGFTAS